MQTFVGMTPLHYAAEKGLDDMVCLLLEANANTDIQDESGSTPLHCAVNASGIVCRDTCERIVQALLDAGADPNLHDDAGMTPLHHAAEFGSGETITKALLIAKADPNRPDGEGMTPLHHAVTQSESVEIVGCRCKPEPA